MTQTTASRNYSVPTIPTDTWDVFAAAATLAGRDPRTELHEVLSQAIRDMLDSVE